eukprot:TRINITY_DN4434_c0_g1_i1.p1 TRINITY_DN4434_c0_g1~~TRINITY_DN4434_c0_g1_i1.p1  ORF type:complete len:100 (-),score=13.94 TRINITY_DN4434_c0_g1_i1:368-667(-)
MSDEDVANHCELRNSIVPLLGYATQPWIRGVTARELDELITAHLVKGVESLLDFLEENLELRTVNRKGNIRTNCFYGSAGSNRQRSSSCHERSSQFWDI